MKALVLRSLNRSVILAGLTGLTILSILFGYSAATAQTLNGAGATFPFPVYSKWAFEYNKVTGMKLNYQSIGSGAGIAQINAKTVDFGASDAPLTTEEMNQAGLVQFPMIMKFGSDHWILSSSSGGAL